MARTSQARIRSAQRHQGHRRSPECTAGGLHQALGNSSQPDMVWTQSNSLDSSRLHCTEPWSTCWGSRSRQRTQGREWSAGCWRSRSQGCTRSDLTDSRRHSRILRDNPACSHCRLGKNGLGGSPRPPSRRGRSFPPGTLFVRLSQWGNRSRLNRKISWKWRSSTPPLGTRGRA